MSDALGVNDLATKLGCDATVARQKLRAAGIDKVDGKYQFKNAKELDAVVKQINGGKKDAGAAPENKATKSSGKKDKAAAEEKSTGLKKKAKK